MKKYIILISFAILFFTSCAHIPSGSPAAGFVREGVTLFNAGKIDDSAILFRKAYAADPNYAPAYKMLGRVYLAKGDTYRAEMFFRKSLALDKSLTEIYGWIGDIYWADGDTDKAMEYYERCPDDDPHYAILHYRIGMRAYQDGRFDDAHAGFEKALNFPDYWGGHYGVGLLAYIDNQYDIAIEHFKKASSDSADPDVLYWIAKCYLKLGSNIEAYLYFKRYTHGEDISEELEHEAEREANRLYDYIAEACSGDLDSLLTMPFKLPSNENISVGVFDIEGRLVKMLFKGFLTHGEYSMTWNGTDSEDNPVDNGIYLGFIERAEGIKLYPLRLSE